ncbi:MAG: hypothetical protein U0470_01625 [Anaerolineae bacterium]
MRVPGERAGRGRRSCSRRCWRRWRPRSTRRRRTATPPSPSASCSRSSSAAEAVVGVLTLRHLAWLRRSWLSAVEAQNQLLRRAVAADPTLKGWFAWLEAPLPRAYNRGSVGWLMAAGVALLTGLASAAVVFIALTLLALRGAAAADAAIGSGAAAAASAFASLVFGLVAFRYGYRAPLEAGGDRASGGLSNRRRRAL